jgi:hypothetical protein
MKEYRLCLLNFALCDMAFTVCCGFMLAPEPDGMLVSSQVTGLVKYSSPTVQILWVRS